MPSYALATGVSLDAQWQADGDGRARGRATLSVGVNALQIDNMLLEVDLSIRARSLFASLIDATLRADAVSVAAAFASRHDTHHIVVVIKCGNDAEQVSRLYRRALL